jgi:hypothetical protein
MDFTAEGLMILTNDGDYAERVQKLDPFIRRYTVKVAGGLPTEPMIKSLLKGAKIEEKFIRPFFVRIDRSFENSFYLELGFIGGGNLDVKSLLMVKGFTVERCIRSGVGPVRLGDLRPGMVVPMTGAEARALVDSPETSLADLNGVRLYLWDKGIPKGLDWTPEIVDPDAILTSKEKRQNFKSKVTRGGAALPVEKDATISKAPGGKIRITSKRAESSRPTARRDEVSARPAPAAAKPRFPSASATKPSRTERRRAFAEERLGHAPAGDLRRRKEAPEGARPSSGRYSKVRDSAPTRSSRPPRGGKSSANTNRASPRKGGRSR